MNSPSTFRLFVAAHLPESIRADLVRAAKPLHGVLPSVRWMRTEALHLTLVFLGERPVDQVEVVARALDAACKELEPFVLALAGNGCFPSVSRARVLWTGLTGDMTALFALRHAVIISLAAAGLIEADERFSPHFTIGRVRDGTPSAERADAGRRWMNLPAPAPTPVHVEAIHLMRGILGPGGPRYMVLHGSGLPKGA